MVCFVDKAVFSVTIKVLNLHAHVYFQAVRTPVRDESGVDLLFQYYNQLYFMEKRFFPPDRRIGIHFTW